jgi:hypothetical protein
LVFPRAECSGGRTAVCSAELTEWTLGYWKGTRKAGTMVAYLADKKVEPWALTWAGKRAAMRAAQLVVRWVEPTAAMTAARSEKRWADQTAEKMVHQ